MLETLEFIEVRRVHHRRDRDLKAPGESELDGADRLPVGPLAPQRVMPGLKSIDTHLNFIDGKRSHRLLAQQQPIREQYLSEGIPGEQLVQCRELPVEERFPAGNQQPQTLHLLKFGEYPFNRRDRELYVFGRAEVTVAAPQIAPPGNLELEVPQG